MTLESIGSASEFFRIEMSSPVKKRIVDEASSAVICNVIIARCCVNNHIVVICTQLA